MAKPEIENFGKIADVAMSDIPALDDCRCGMEPVEYNLIIAPAEQKAKIGTIFIPDESREKLGLAKQVGRIVAASPLAFSYDAWPEGSRMPQVGDVVWFARYAGGEFEGADNKTYRIIKDKDVGGVISRAAAAFETLNGSELDEVVTRSDAETRAALAIRSVLNGTGVRELGEALS